MVNKVGVETRPSGFVCPSDTALPFVTNTGLGPTVNAAIGSYALVTGTNGPSQGISEAVKFSNTGLFVYRNTKRFADVLDGTSNTLGVGEVSDGHLANDPNIWSVGSRHAHCLRTTENPINTPPGGGILYTTLNGAFMSRHTSGANFALADGSVRFLQQNMDITLYRGPLHRPRRRSRLRPVSEKAHPMTLSRPPRARVARGPRCSCWRWPAAATAAPRSSPSPAS